jgi:flavorubredoxin
MDNFVKINDSVYVISVNDRRKELFENIWPLPEGVCYNSYVIIDEKIALLDTVESTRGAGYVDSIARLLGDRQPDYLIVNHMELDHSGEVGEIKKRWPNIQIVGNAKTFKMIEGYYGITDGLVEVADGDELDLGKHKLKFVFTPWVHWPESMVTYDATDQILFSADAFGTFGTLDGALFDDQFARGRYDNEMRRYYSNIVGKFSGMVQKAFAKLAGVPVKIIAPLHGPIWREDPGYVLGLYDRWSKYEADDAVVVIYGTMYENTAAVADRIARTLAQQGVRDIRVYDASKTHVSFLISEMWRCKGIILGSCAYNGEMLPTMTNVISHMSHLSLKNRYLGLFGSFTWNGGGVRRLAEFAEKSGWEQVAAPVEIFGMVTPEKLATCDAMATAMAERIVK